MSVGVVAEQGLEAPGELSGVTGTPATQQNTQTCPGLGAGLPKEEGGVSMCMAPAPWENTLPPTFSSSLETKLLLSSLRSHSGILCSYIFAI